MHVRLTGSGKSILATSVDDMLIASSSKSESDEVTKGLQQPYEITDYSEVEWLLGCKIERWHEQRSLKVSQEALSILREYGFDKGKSAATLIPPKAYLTMSMSPGNNKEKEEMK